MSMESSTYFVSNGEGDPVELSRQQILDQFPDADHAQGIFVQWQKQWIPLWDLAQQWAAPVFAPASPVAEAAGKTPVRRAKGVVSVLNFFGALDIVGAIIFGLLSGTDASMVAAALGCLVSSIVFFAFAAVIDLLSRIEFNTRK